MQILMGFSSPKLSYPFKKKGLSGIGFDQLQKKKKELGLCSSSFYFRD